MLYLGIEAKTLNERQSMKQLLAKSFHSYPVGLAQLAQALAVECIPNGISRNEENK